MKSSKRMATRQKNKFDNYMKDYVSSDDDSGTLDLVKFQKNVRAKYGDLNADDGMDYSKYDKKTEEELEEEKEAAEKEKQKADAAAAAAAAKKKEAEKEEDFDMTQSSSKGKKK